MHVHAHKDMYRDAGTQVQGHTHNTHTGANGRASSHRHRNAKDRHTDTLV